jgi:serine-type D-Ala-D-Ala carboxypeptidase
MRALEKALTKKIKTEIPELDAITPGMMIEVFKKGEIQAHLHVGETSSYYDLASLTKLLFSATAWMRWVGKADFDLNLPVRYFLPWWKSKDTLITELMTHSAGLNWWQPYYKSLKGPNRFDHRWPQMQALLEKGTPGPKGKSVYSDLDLFVLGFLIQELEQKSINEIWTGIAEELGLHHMHYHVNNKPVYSKGLYAPTEQCDWRKKVLQGEVHDENTWALGGVAPHSGLFSNIHDVSRWALLLRKAHRGENDHFGSQAIVRNFTKRQLPKTNGAWGYLFMKPSQRASCGRHFSKLSFGHTGFTGTSIWMDPVKDLIVVILSNRVYPTRKNQQFVQLRPYIHDWICELL